MLAVMLWAGAAGAAVFLAAFAAAVGRWRGRVSTWCVAPGDELAAVAAL